MFLQVHYQKPCSVFVQCLIGVTRSAPSPLLLANASGLSFGYRSQAWRRAAATPVASDRRGCVAFVLTGTFLVSYFPLFFRILNVNVGMQATLDRILSTDPSAWPRSLPQADTVVGLGRDGTDADPLPFQNTTEYVGYFERLAEVELCSELSSVLEAVFRALSTAPSIRQAASTIQVYPRGGPVPFRGPRALSTNVHTAPASSEAATDALLDIPIKIQSKETIFDNDILLLLLDVEEDRGVPSPLLSRVRKEPVLAAVQHRAGSPLTLRLRRDRAEAWLTSQGASSTTPDADETAGGATACRSCVGIRLVSTLNYAREFAALASIDEMDLAADILDPVTGAQRQSA
ncbi:hypothetical protein F1559_000958 [Cyanidiococcus yangmingshanensis]|uniref:Uncharacterized protein n=1 Tax=Cyanidiococcus yangmingshanensis TaxID=2690220 RepID=A0A7J7IKY2_9RHOD|nr:hypothetical protein F1559_000958 [Cyanidiococcus yangmingshanensis]